MKKLFVKAGARYRPALKSEIAEAAAVYITGDMRGIKISAPRDTVAYLRSAFGGYDHEIFAVVFLNNRHYVIECEVMFRGTIDGASVHPREICKRALELNAAALILVHNHPSGDHTPSNADLLITKKLVEATTLLDMRIIDHVIVSCTGSWSMAEKGQI